MNDKTYLTAFINWFHVHATITTIEAQIRIFDTHPWRTIKAMERIGYKFRRIKTKRRNKSGVIRRYYTYLCTKTPDKKMTGSGTARNQPFNKRKRNK